jgi:hypothetical protein
MTIQGNLLSRPILPDAQGAYGFEMKVIAFITERDVIDATLRHVATAETRSPRGPPGATTLLAVS